MLAYNELLKSSLSNMQFGGIIDETWYTSKYSGIMEITLKKFFIVTVKYFTKYSNCRWKMN